MSGSDSYSWIGGTAGTWGTASNWEDLTTGTVAAVAPGIGNDATIGTGVTVYGTGSAASLTTTQYGGTQVTLAADLNVGTLATSGFLTLTGATIVGGNITLGQILLNALSQEQVYAIYSSVIGTGSIEVLTGGTLNVFASDSANVTYQLDGNANFLVVNDEDPGSGPSGIGSGSTIILNGAANTIDIASTYELQVDLFGMGTPQISAPIEGFNTTDQIDYVGNTFTAAAFSDGTLTLTGTGSAQTLYLTGDYSADTFEVNGGVVTAVPTASLSQSYSWIGGTAGTWGNAANWEDLTTETVAATAPGIEDTAIIGEGTILGTGTAAILVVQGDVSVGGNMNAGTLVVAAGLTIDIGNTIFANTATITDAGSLEGSLNASDQGELVVSGTLWLDSQIGPLLGYTQADSLVLNDANPQIIGTIELGNAGVAAPLSGDVGEVVIDQGHTLSGTGGLFDYDYRYSGTPVYANGIVNGLVSSANLQIGVVVDGRATNYSYIDFLGTSLNGTGTVEILTGGTIYVAANVTGSGLTFQLDGSATLETAGTIATGNTITMDGSADTLLVNGGNMLPTLITTTYGILFDPDNLPPVPPITPFIGGTIHGFNPTDEIDIRGIAFDAAYWSGGTLDLLQGTSVVDTLTLDGDYADFGFVVTGTSYAGQPEEIVTIIACFAAGTCIDTKRGAIPVEHLHEGDMVLTVSGGCQPIKWIGHRTLDLRRHPAPEQVQPVRIAAHAFGNDRPRQPLLLSPDHAVYAEGVLIPIKYLANGTTVTQLDTATVTYYHVELPRHDVVLAEGLPAESYLDTGDRSNFANGGALATMHPNFSRAEACEALWATAGYAPLRIEGEAFDRVAARLRNQAALLGRLRAHEKRRRSEHSGTKTADLARLLNPAWYLAHNPDVAHAGVDASEHYVRWGHQEGRLPCDEITLLKALGLVDPGTIAFTMADVVVAGLDPVAHFCTTGWHERRRPNPYFDTCWYLDTYAVPAGTNPLLHYVLLGEHRGLAPSRHFDPVWYRQHYAIGPTESPLAHYLRHRHTRRFSPLPSFDVAAYLQDHASSLLPDRDPYMHFLAYGRFVPTSTEQAGRFAA